MYVFFEALKIASKMFAQVETAPTPEKEEKAPRAPEGFEFNQLSSTTRVGRRGGLLLRV